MPGGRKLTVTLELDADLLTAVERLGPDLASTVERALRRDLPRHMTDEELERFVADAREHYERYGLAGEEHLPV